MRDHPPPGAGRLEPLSVLAPDLDQWPFTIPAVAELIRNEGLEIPPGVTFLNGENGTGNSN